MVVLLLYAFPQPIRAVLESEASVVDLPLAFYGLEYVSGVEVRGSVVEVGLQALYLFILALPCVIELSIPSSHRTQQRFVSVNVHAEDAKVV
jgi:hypothetical protein